MNSPKQYCVPDILDLIYDDIIRGECFNSLYSANINRIKLVKCNIACDILLNSGCSEEYIVSSVGFPSLDMFRDTFTEYLGVTPMDFRKRFGQKNRGTPPYLQTDNTA